MVGKNWYEFVERPSSTATVAEAQVTPTERELVQRVREIGYGEVTAVVREGKITIIRELRTTRMDDRD